jgi:hypothetical protein
MKGIPAGGKNRSPPKRSLEAQEGGRFKKAVAKKRDVR